MMDGKNFLYEFGPYRLNASERVLMRGVSPVRLTPKAYATLIALLENSGHVVNKDELMKLVWPDAFVEDSNLTQNIFTLRRILGKNRDNPRYIETVPRRGYRFAATVRRVSEDASPPASAADSHEVVGKIAGVQANGGNRALAVLPFANASGDVKMDYLSDGITESIINSLSQLPRLRVMSRSAVFRQKGQALDAQRIGKSLGVDAVLVGRVHSREGRLLVSTELVDVANGWQLWGENYDRGQGAIFDVQEEIARQISAALKLRLTGAEEQLLTKRYTESSEAYQAYLQGRYHWSKYNRDGIEQAIGHFRQAINLDPNYALAYAGIVDCYLRLATNYILPEDDPPQTAVEKQAPEIDDAQYEASTSLKIRYEWDRKAAEREIKRTIELKSNYPAAHQWYAAYLYSKRLYDEASTDGTVERESNTAANAGRGSKIDAALLEQIQSSRPTLAEEVQIFCMIAREQMEAGNYEAGCAVLRRWWTFGEWPRLEGLSTHMSADLLFTAGALAGFVASSRQVPRGQKHGEELLNGAIALFEQLGAKTRSAEGRIELALSYYREGLFELARTTLLTALEVLSGEDSELRYLGLIRLASLERHSGRLHDSLARLKEVGEIVELAGPWATGRYHHELATTLKELAVAEARTDYFDQALEYYREALRGFEAIGNHSNAAIVENSHGYLLLTLKRLDRAEGHLVRARNLFDGFSDKVRRAQVDDTLARLHLAEERFDLAERASARAVETLGTGDEEALFAEALTTQGVVLSKMGRHREAKRSLDSAYRVAERCGDVEGAGLALLIVIEEMCDQLEDGERLEVGDKLDQLLAHSQQESIRKRLGKCREMIADKQTHERELG